MKIEDLREFVFVESNQIKHFFLNSNIIEVILREPNVAREPLYGSPCYVIYTHLKQRY
jgi:hypothetical protein